MQVIGPFCLRADGSTVNYVEEVENYLSEKFVRYSPHYAEDYAHYTEHVFFVFDISTEFLNKVVLPGLINILAKYDIHPRLLKPTHYELSKIAVPVPPNFRGY